MSIRLYETGLNHVAGGLAALCSPTADKLEQIANDMRAFAFSASHSGETGLISAANEAEVAARSLLVGEGDAHDACALALHRMGDGLLLSLFQYAQSAKVFVESRWFLEKKILVVDDSRVAAVALSNAFVAHDFMVRTVATMEEALSALTVFAPTILVSDIHMPDLDVAVLCSTFRELSRGRPTRTVLVSSMTGDELQARIDEVKPDGFVSKMSGSAAVVARVLEMWNELNP